MKYLGTFRAFRRPHRRRHHVRGGCGWRRCHQRCRRRRAGHGDRAETGLSNGSTSTPAAVLTLCGHRRDRAGGLAVAAGRRGTALVLHQLNQRNGESDTPRTAADTGTEDHRNRASCPPPCVHQTKAGQEDVERCAPAGRRALAARRHRALTGTHGRVLLMRDTASLPKRAVGAGVRAVPGPPQAPQAITDAARELLSGAPARRYSRSGNRYWIEVRGLDGRNADGLGGAVPAALRSHPDNGVGAAQHSAVPRRRRHRRRNRCRNGVR